MTGCTHTTIYNCSGIVGAVNCASASTPPPFYKPLSINTLPFSTLIPDTRVGLLSIYLLKKLLFRLYYGK